MKNKTSRLSQLFRRTLPRDGLIFKCKTNSGLIDSIGLLITGTWPNITLTVSAGCPLIGISPFVEGGSYYLPDLLRNTGNQFFWTAQSGKMVAYSTAKINDVAQKVLKYLKEPLWPTGIRVASLDPPPYTDFLNAVYPDYVPIGNTYYMRADGTAASLAQATSADSAATSLSKGESGLFAQIQPGDVIVISGKGGPYPYIYARGKGAADNPVTYIPDPLSPPNVGRLFSLASYQNLIDLESNASGLVDCFSFNSSDPAVNGAGIVGVKTYNLKAMQSTNQGYQHEGTLPLDVTHYNLYAENCADEGLSCHNSPTVVVHGGAIRNCRSAVNWVNLPHLTLNNMWMDCAAGYRPIDASAVVGAEVDIAVNGCCLIHDQNLSGWVNEFTLGSVAFSNTSFYGLNNTFLMVFRNTLTEAIFNGNLLVGGKLPRSVKTIFNGLATGDYSGNTFISPVANNMFSGASGDITGNVEFVI